MLLKQIFVVISPLACITIASQDQTIKALQGDAGKSIKKDAADTSIKTWKKGGLYSLKISQASLSNWAAGGDDFSFSVNSLLSLYDFYKKDKNSWDNTFDFNIGYVNTTSLDSRKNAEIRC